MTNNNTLPIPSPSHNGTGKPRKGKPAKQAESKPTKQSSTLSTVKAWSNGYVIGAGLISCGLNALANGQHAPAHLTIPAYLLGTAIPMGVLALGKVASTLWVRGSKHLAKVIGAIAGLVLALSVYHCQESITLLTGSPWYLAAAMAVGLDAGMIGCEIAATVESKGK